MLLPSLVMLFVFNQSAVRGIVVSRQIRGVNLRGDTVVSASVITNQR